MIEISLTPEAVRRWLKTTYKIDAIRRAGEKVPDWMVMDNALPTSESVALAKYFLENRK